MGGPPGVARTYPRFPYPMCFRSSGRQGARRRCGRRWRSGAFSVSPSPAERERGWDEGAWRRSPSSALAGTFSRKREKGSSNLDHNRPMPTILVIDDNPSVATALDVLFSLHDIDTLRAESPEAGLEQLQRGDVDLVIQDMNFHADTTSGEEGVALFHDLRARHPDLPVILLTAWTPLEADRKSTRL